MTTIAPAVATTTSADLTATAPLRIYEDHCSGPSGRRSGMYFDYVTKPTFWLHVDPSTLRRTSPIPSDEESTMTPSLHPYRHNLYGQRHGTDGLLGYVHHLFLRYC